MHLRGRAASETSVFKNRPIGRQTSVLRGIFSPRDAAAENGTQHHPSWSLAGATLGL